MNTRTLLALALLAISARASVPTLTTQDQMTASALAFSHVLSVKGAAKVVQLLPTGSNAAYWGNLPGFAATRQISRREVKIGDMVVRDDTHTCHLVSRREGAMVYTKGASNYYEDPRPVTGQLWLVTHAYFYPAK